MVKVLLTFNECLPELVGWFSFQKILLLLKKILLKALLIVFIIGNLEKYWNMEKLLTITFKNDQRWQRTWKYLLIKNGYSLGQYASCLKMFPCSQGRC